jgi:3-oxoacyl-[acyl-carrier protein] reductase
MNDNSKKQSGRVALVTGGSRGIGAEIVRRLATDGADVAFTYNTGHAEAQGVAAHVRDLGRKVLTVGADLAVPEAAGAVADAVKNEFGSLDVLVNNAGVTHWGPLAGTSLADFDRLVAVNARGPFLMMQAAAGLLADGGRIVNVSSAVTSTALPGSALYAGTKAFLDQVTRVAAPAHHPPADCLLTDRRPDPGARGLLRAHGSGALPDRPERPWPPGGRDQRPSG